MDKNQLYSYAYEYLSHLEEAKRWMEIVLKEPIPLAINLEENLRNGVFLAKLANFIFPDKIPLSRIYDIFQHRYRCCGLQFRHTDNINYWNDALKLMSFPKTFIVETMDIYNKKNISKVIYCIHALSYHLFSKGIAPPVHCLFQKVKFSGEYKTCSYYCTMGLLKENLINHSIHYLEEDIAIICQRLEKNEINLLSCQKILNLLTEQSVDVSKLQIELHHINKAIDEKEEEELLITLKNNLLGLVEIFDENMCHYKYALKRAKVEKHNTRNNTLNKVFRTDCLDASLNLIEIQGHIREVNMDCIWQNILKLINKKCKLEELKEFISLKLSQIKDYREQNLDYYVREVLKIDLNSVKSWSSREIILTVVRNGNRSANENHRITDALVRVKQSIANNNKEQLLIALKNPSLKLSSQVSEFAASLYLEEISEDLKMSKEITLQDLKSSILVLNEIAKITKAVDSCDHDKLWKHLSNPHLPFMNIDSSLKIQYLKALKTCREKKILQNFKNSILTFIDIQECIDMAYHHSQKIGKNGGNEFCASIKFKKINEAMRDSNDKKLISTFQALAPNIISNDNVSLCILLLKKYLTEKQLKVEALMFNDIVPVIKDVKAHEQLAFEICKNLNEKYAINTVPENILLSMESPKKSALKQIDSQQDTWFAFKCPEMITLYVNPIKKIYKWSKPPELKEINLKYLTNIDLPFSCQQLSVTKYENCFINKGIVALQSIIRGFLIRRKIKNIIKSVIAIQRWWRKIKQTKTHECGATKIDLIYYINNINKVVKIQALWRGYRCRKLMHFGLGKSLSMDPSFRMLKRLVLSRQINGLDYSIDLKIQTMKSSVVKIIKLNQDLALKLEEMDLKIGLLVQNRMSVEAILTENKKAQSSWINRNNSKGIKAFTKEGKRLLDGYQQLFYLLQIDPTYLTRLIVDLPSKLNHVIQSCVFSLFNYGSNSRDAYLLLRLFRSALFEEVHNKFEKPIDAITRNPFVLRLAVAFARQVEGHNPLKNILGFLIEKVLNDKVYFDTNPVDIYHRWVNQLEMKSGKPLDLPQTVTQEEAMTYPEVVQRLNHNLRILKSWIKCFLERLVTCVNQFPYALRFIAKFLKNVLLQKFPQTPEKDILKIIANLIYYQYINSAIVAPDAFYTVSLPSNKPMRIEQRKNLATIAKILHFASTKKGFGEESKYLMCLNPFIIECHKEMKRFCQSCCAVDDLEDYFHVTKYSEASLITKPKIYITLEEIREFHKLLLEFRQEIAPNSFDPIHDILDELGDPPLLSSLVGCENSQEENFSRAGKTQICLELDNKTKVPVEDLSEAEDLFIRTKELIVNRLKKLNGRTMSIAIRHPEHVDIAINLAKLELAGLVSSSDDYQDMIKSILKDIIHEQECRRLQKAELVTLTIALRRLNEKKKYFEDQLSHYEEYLKTCLKNLKTSGKGASNGKGKSLKYSGTRLREKGILISLNGVPSAQLKNVQFEILATEFNGIYCVHGRFMGVEVEKIDVDIQELLKLQFEGLREINLFGKALINVNLLLHLLNRKFNARI